MTALSMVAPHYCLICGKIGLILCENCKNDIIYDAPSGCIRCGALTDESGVCASCSLPYSHAWAAGSYRHGLETVIQNMKFDGTREAAHQLGVLIAERLPHLPVEAVLTPIPTIAPHKRFRGFDHTSIMANEVAKQHNVSVENILKRKTNSVQFGKTKKERIEQANSTFAVSGNVSPTTIYVLIDDVMTTGASLAAAATVLLEAGAREVWVAVAARHSLDEEQKI